MSNYLSDFDISGYGLSAQRFRMNVISSNIANANTVRTAEGGPYRRREVIFKAVDFDSVLNDEVAKKHNLLEYENPLDDKFYTKDAKPAIMSVVVDKIVRDDKDSPRRRREGLRSVPKHQSRHRNGGSDRSHARLSGKRFGISVG